VCLQNAQPNALENKCQVAFLMQILGVYHAFSTANHLPPNHAVAIRLNANVEHIAYQKHYTITTNQGDFQSSSLVIATGGASIPKMGATDFGLQIAKQFGLKSINFKPALVPFTFHQDDINCYFKDLSGLSIDAIVQCNNQSFREGVLITHRGISGPAVLQISSYWQKGDTITLNLLPDLVASDCPPVAITSDDD
jgi:predicted flavoprotein YhiN